MQAVKRLLSIARNGSFHLSDLRKCKNKSHVVASQSTHSIVGSVEGIQEDDIMQSEYEEISNEYLGIVSGGHRAFVIQPFIKWGNDKRRNTTPQLQLEEAVALIDTLPNWSVIDKTCVPLLTLQRKELLGKGRMKNVKDRIKKNRNISAIFISTNILKYVQIQTLQEIFGLPVYDRYSIVIQIFRAHAQSPEARLQVAIAELPYIKKKMGEMCEAAPLFERRKMLLHARESKLRDALRKLKDHRELLRSKRTVSEFPSVAIVGYTNCGKTSLIKALTGDETMQPRNQLFATLDTTAHQGLLPSRVKVLYMDTIGFIQDVPETLIEPFVATLEDAMIADVIVHVYDASHPDMEAQVDHVRATLSSLIHDKKPILEIANKCDLIEPGTLPDGVLGVSAVCLTGIDILRSEIEKELLAATGRTMKKMRVRSGSREAAWLYKETTVTNAEADPEDPQFMILYVIITEVQMHRFRKFLKQ